MQLLVFLPVNRVCYSVSVTAKILGLLNLMYAKEARNANGSMEVE